MYEFRDTTQTALEGDILPSEALKINGEYIENIIPGYRTLQVTGREALSAQLTTYETGNRDGVVLSGKKYPPRYITVKYQLIAETPEDFRAAYNQLGGILNVEEAELIFNDEQDKFFIGTPEAVGETPGGTNAVVSEFTLFCADPFKYSVTEYEVSMSEEDYTIGEKSILIDYNGTHRAYPTLEAEFYQNDGSNPASNGWGDCGYVAFFNESEKIIQLGNPNEADTEEYAKSQTLDNSKFNTETAWGTLNQTNWATNQGNLANSGIAQIGSMEMAVASYLVTTAPSTSGKLLTVTSRAEKPYVKYQVSAKTSGRTADSVKVKVTITTSLAEASNYFGTKRGLKGSIQFNGGDWHTATIKSTSAKWSGNGGHSVTLTVTVKGLDATTTKIEDIKFKVERVDDLGKTGILDETTCNDLPISEYTAPVPDTWYLMPGVYGSNAGWHGASITRTLPADDAGAVGAKNCTFSWRQKMSIGSSSYAQQELGIFQALLVNGSKVVAGVSIVKNKTGKKATLNFIVNGKFVHKMDIDLSLNNKYMGNNNSAKGIKTVKTSTIIKSGKKVQFNIGGITKTFNDNGIANTDVKQTTFFIGGYGTKPVLSYNGLYWAKLVKNNCDTWEDIPNKFSDNDVVTADCKTGEIRLNDTLTPSLGALGNDWEEFYLTPGLNQIGFSFSDFTFYQPTIKIRYREVFL